MSAKFVLNQDRDNVYRFKPNALFYAAPIEFDGHPFGFNLMMGNALLGTFDSFDSAVSELNALFNCTSEVYAVSGFSDWGADI